MEKPMKDIRELRRYAAQRHADVPQLYEPGVPYWIHLFIVELVAIAFSLEARIRRGCWGHDLGEDTGATYTDLRQAGWTAEEAGDIDRVTDEPGDDRNERKKKTLPKTARGGHNGIGIKLCDRVGNVIFGLLSGSVRSVHRYKQEHEMLVHYLMDTSDPRLLPLWYFIDYLFTMQVKPMTPEEFAQRPLMKLIEKWKSEKEFIMNADKVDLLPYWLELKALLDAQYKR
jgi:hypothetical protein